MSDQGIKQATVSLERVNDDPYPKGQADYNGKTTEFLRLSPSGLDTNPTEGTWVLLLSIQGQESMKVGIPCDLLGASDSPAENPGETVLYNKNTGDKVYLKNDGTIEITASTEVVITAPSVKLGGAAATQGVARIGDAVAGGVITGGSAIVKSL
jgi:phage gp45-like